MHHHDHKHESITTWRLLVTMAMNFTITIVEVIGGLAAGSLSLLSDALHNLTDGIAVIFSYIAIKLQDRKSTPQRTYGYKRAEIIAAFFNALILVLVCFYLIREAIERFFNPVFIDGSLMLFVALTGLVANSISVLLLHRSSKENVNIKSAYIHLLADAISSISVIVGAVLIYFFNILWLDPFLTLILAGYILKESISIVRYALNILMQTTPEHVDINEIRTYIYSLGEVTDAHHIHAWQLNESSFHLEAHVLIEKDILLSKVDSIRLAIEDYLLKEFRINHVTLQFEACPCESFSCCD